MGDSGAGRLLRSAWCSAPAASSARPTRPASFGPAARDRLGPARRPPSSSAPPPARSPARRCASGCPPRTWRRRSTGCPPSRRGGAILRRILPADVEPLPTPSVGSLLRPWNLPSPALITRAVRRPLAFRPDVAAMTLLPRGRIDISERARGPRRAHGQSLAGRAADLHGPPLGRGPGRLRPRRRATGPPGRRRAGLVRHPRLLPTGRHRGHRVRRRWRALGHQRGRAPVRGARRGRRHLLHVGRPRQCQRGRRLAPADRAPAHGARDRPAAGGRGRRDQPGARRASRAAPWDCGPWPRTGARR